MSYKMSCYFQIYSSFWLKDSVLKWTFKDVFHKHNEKRFGTFMRRPQCGKRNLKAAAC